MKFLPIVTRELTVAARRKATHWTRLLSAATAVLISAWMITVMSGSLPQETAKTLFGVMTALMTLYCALAGVRFTADCLSVERREGTLGLLFLTNLRGHDVILGKLAASSLDAFYGALAIVPVLGLPLLMGGVTFGEFGRLSLVALNTLFFSLAAGMLASALFRSAQLSGWVTLLLLLIFSAGLPSLDAYLMRTSPVTRAGLPWGFVSSPGYAYALGFDAMYRMGAWRFWTSMGVIHGLAWLWLGLAAFVLPRMWQDRPYSGTAGGLGHRLRVWLRGDTQNALRYRRRLLDQNAYFWLTSRKRWKPGVAWLVLVILAGIWGWGWHQFRSDWLNEGTYFTTGIVLNFLFRVWFASEASQQLAEDHHSGALELLLSTPITVNEILYGQFLSLRRLFLGPLICILLVESVLFSATLKEVRFGPDHALWTCLWLGMGVMTLLDLATLFWVSQWMGLTARQPNRASANSLALVFFPTWLMVFLVAMANIAAGSGTGGWQPYFSLWFLFGAVADIALAVWAHTRLRERFRSAAQKRFEPTKGLMEVLAGK